ncbi:hypothetical protein CALCODRAFT_437249 [Calocera cornea HHB12733]|uniref:Uncharacterized protein n=1 Tax=Calocera cornea HHB12733 TaxID=1353952 RepID=A0A165ESG9_9BASI|nr:hypothetical protein CALCODRAFT_437249 [Calocera cornea HHB12733]
MAHPFDSCDFSRLAVLSARDADTRDEVSEYLLQAWHINTILLKFIAPDRCNAFRLLMFKTGAIISGSQALQLLMRTNYIGSDLDLYLHYQHTSRFDVFLAHEGYVLQPRPTTHEFYIPGQRLWNGKQQTSRESPSP